MSLIVCASLGATLPGYSSAQTLKRKLAVDRFTTAHSDKRFVRGSFSKRMWYRPSVLAMAKADFLYAFSC